MNLVGPYVKAVLSNPNLWFWGVAFMGFWVVLGAFVFDSGISLTRGAIEDYTASWYGIIALYSLSMLAVGLSGSLAYNSPSLAYLFRYSRLSPRDYVVSLLAGCGALGIALGVMMLGIVTGTFSARFGVALALVDPAALVLVALAGGLFMAGLAMTLMLTVVNYLGLRNTNLVSFGPLLLSYVFGFSELFVSLPSWLLYASPFSDFAALMYLAFRGYLLP